MGFQKAVKTQIKPKIVLIGPSGSGKTYSALRLATGIIKKTGGRIAFIDSENKRGKYYANEFDYDYMELKAPYTPEKYITAVDDAIGAQYSVVIVDSATHEWSGPGGILEIKSKMTGTNDYTKWESLTPRHNAFLNKMLLSDIIVICCVRGKDEYALELNDKGKQVPRKIGLGADFRNGLEFEATCAFMCDQENHVAQVMKDNTHIFDGTNGVKLYEVLTEKHGEQIMDWANSGEAEIELPKPKPTVVKLTPPIDQSERDAKMSQIIDLMGKLGWDGNKLKEECIKLVGKENSSEYTVDEFDEIIDYMKLSQG